MGDAMTDLQPILNRELPFSHGILKPVQSRSGINVFVANVSCTAFDDEDLTGQTEHIDEACIILTRRTLSGLGLAHLIPMRDFWRVADGSEQIDQIFGQAAKELFGDGASVQDQRLVGDLIFNAMDPLFEHPPEYTLKQEAEMELKRIERDGLYLVINDQVVVDAR